MPKKRKGAKGHPSDSEGGGPGTHSGRLVTVATELRGRWAGTACKGKNSRKVEMLRGENSQKTLEDIGEGDNSSLPSGRTGRSPALLQTLETLCCGWGAEGSP